MADRRGKMRFALPRQTEQECVVATADELPRAQLPQLSSQARVETLGVKRVERLAWRQMGTLQQTLDPPLATSHAIEIEQVARVLLERPLLSGSHSDDIADGLPCGRHSERREALLQFRQLRARHAALDDDNKPSYTLRSTGPRSTAGTTAGGG